MVKTNSTEAAEILHSARIPRLYNTIDLILLQIVLELQFIQFILVIYSPIFP